MAAPVAPHNATIDLVVEEAPLLVLSEPPKSSRAEKAVTFYVPLAGYLVVSFLLALHYHAFYGDAQSREANAFYVFFSRDPHLAAIGFVWNPLTSIVQMPLILFRGLFPALTQETLAANIMSALAMSGACYHLHGFMQDLRVGRLTRWVLLACFAVNPMIILFGGNGMSEALFCFTLAVTARYLARWLNQRDLRSLVTCGVFLGLAYLARNEVVAGAAAGVLLVGGATYVRTVGSRQLRRVAALTDAVIFIVPFLVAFGGWAAVSWITVGHPFEQFSSAYGTASQIKLLGSNAYNGGNGIGHFRYVVEATWSMAPLIPLLLWGAVRQAWRSRNPAVLAVLGILGPVCLFEVAAYTFGQITWAYRYVIYMVLFSVMIAACLASPAAGSTEASSQLVIPPESAPVSSGAIRFVTRRRSIDFRVGLGSLLAVLLTAPGIFSTGHTMLYSRIDAVDQQLFNWVIWPNSRSAQGNPMRLQWASIHAEARTLDALHLPHGAVMLDNFEGCIPQLILASTRPKQFAIPNDEDFKEKLGAPYESGVRYFFVGQPSGLGVADALNVEYPTLYDTGANIATLVGTINMAGCPTFRLYKLIPQTS